MDLYSYIFDTNNESAQRIAKACIDYPISLCRCAEIIELMGPVCSNLSPSGTIEQLKMNIETDSRLTE